MGYKHGATQTATHALPIEQIRRRNAELRLELTKLTAEQAHLEPKVEAMRVVVSAARKTLTRQIKDLDTIRDQQSDITKLTKAELSTEPIHGGPEGLRAATDEIKAHEDQGLKLSKPAKRGTGPSHGTARRYEAGCRCVACGAAKKAKVDRYRTNLKRRLGTL